MAPLPPGLAGALDLNALRGDRAGQERMAIEAMVEHALLCGCGERYRDEALTAYGVFKGVLPTAEGPRDGAVVVLERFHSRQCPLFLDALAHGLSWEGSEQAGLRGRGSSRRGSCRCWSGWPTGRRREQRPAYAPMSAAGVPQVSFVPTPEFSVRPWTLHGDLKDLSLPRLSVAN